MAWRQPAGYGVRVEATNSHEERSDHSEGEIQALISSAQGLVESLAVQVAQECSDAIPKEDLIAYGHQGLLEAALRYESDRGAAFRTFAYYRVRGAMIDGLRKMGPWSRRGFERVALLRAESTASEDLALQGDDPKKLQSKEAADRLRKHMASMVTAMTSGVFFAGSLQGAGGASSDETPPPLRAIDPSSNAEEQLGKLEMYRLVHRTVDELPPPEDEVVRRFYVEGDNMDAIARDLGRSRSWVSRVHTRALARMGARLRSESMAG